MVTEICAVVLLFQLKLRISVPRSCELPVEESTAITIYLCLICLRRVRNSIERFLYVLMIPRFVIRSNVKCFFPSRYGSLYYVIGSGNSEAIQSCVSVDGKVVGAAMSLVTDRHADTD